MSSVKIVQSVKNVSGTTTTIRAMVEDATVSRYKRKVWMVSLLVEGESKTFVDTWAEPAHDHSQQGRVEKLSEVVRRINQGEFDALLSKVNN